VTACAASWIAVDRSTPVTVQQPTARISHVSERHVGLAAARVLEARRRRGVTPCALVRRSAWEQGLVQADRELGIDALELPFAGHAWLDALDPDIELADLRHSAPTTLP
jgi:hypothetical protein